VFWPVIFLVWAGVVAVVLAALGKRPLVILPSGLQYEEVIVGDGVEARDGMRVTVLCTGRLAGSDKVFTSNTNRNDEPYAFDLGKGQVIKGWEEGIPGMKVGGKRKLMIPAKLGYGERGAKQGIPPNADLEFDVELVRVENASSRPRSGKKETPPRPPPAP
jgi:FKBP-type peptidyl-prolyl cis-trans isomerase FkpA